MSSAPLRASAIVMLYLSIGLVVGCRLVETTTQITAAKPPNSLPSIQTTADAITLEVMFVERPVSDPLLGSQLWSEVDQLSAIDSPTRRRLLDNGIRVGHGSSQPPRALQTLLGLQTNGIGVSPWNEQQRLVGRRVVLQSGGETEVQASPIYPSCNVEIVGPDGGRNTLELENARGIFRLHVERDQEGWAQVRITPEIHHGQDRLRHVTSPSGGWQLRTTQQIESQFDQAFTLTLNVGEMAVLGYNRDTAGSMGQFFFRNANFESPVERLVVVRLANMKSVELNPGQ